MTERKRQRRRTQFLAAPQWRAIRPPASKAATTRASKAATTSASKAATTSAATYVPAEAEVSILCPWASAFEPLAAAEKRSRELEDSDSSSSDSDSSDSEAEEVGLNSAPVPSAALLNGQQRSWPDPAVTDLLIQQACCPLDLALDPAIDMLEASWSACYLSRGGSGHDLGCPAQGSSCYAAACAPRSKDAKAPEATAPDSAGCSHCWKLRQAVASPLRSSAVLLGYQDEWIEAQPGVLPLWEKTPLEPYSAPKAVVYYALCPDGLQGQAQRFLRDLSTTYKAAGLGTHRAATQGASQRGLSSMWVVRGVEAQPCVPASEALRRPPSEKAPGTAADPQAFAATGSAGAEKAESPEAQACFLRGLQSACEDLQALLASKPPMSLLRYVGSLDDHWDAAVVVYLILPEGGRGLATRAFLEAASRLAPATPASALLSGNGGLSSRASLGRQLDVTLQMVTHECLSDLSGAALRCTAFSTYQKIRRQPCASDAATDNLPPPPTPPVIAYGPNSWTHSPPFDAQHAADTKSPPPGQGLKGMTAAVPTANGPVATEMEAKEVASVLSRTPQASSSLLHEPLFVLPGSTTRALDEGQAGPEPLTLHCCYAWAGDCPESLRRGRAPGGHEDHPGCRWVGVCWTDNRGELLEARLLPGPCAPPGPEGPARTSTSGREALVDMCEALLQATLRLAARATAAAGNRAKLKRIVLTRLGDASPSELSAWDALLARPDARGAWTSGLESITLLSLTTDLPMPLEAAWEQPAGPFLLQHASAGSANIVWMPPAAPAAALLPSEADKMRVLHLEILHHFVLRGTGSTRSCNSPAMPATPSDGPGSDSQTTGPSQPDAKEQRRATVSQVALELHQLAILNAAFHGLCLLNPASPGGLSLGTLGAAGPRGHLPLHCNVAERLWALACGAEDWSQTRTY